MKAFARQGSRNRAIRTDQPMVETKLPGHRESKRMPASRDQDDFDPSISSSLQCSNVPFRDSKMGTQERAVNIDCEKTDGESHWSDFNIRSGA
jgi:hypothetical protein